MRELTASLTRSANPERRATSRLWMLAKLTLAVVLIAAILWRTNPRDLARIWQQISVPWLVASMVTFYGSTWLMTLRYWYLLRKQLAFRDLLGLVIVQTVMGNLIATSVSTVSYIGVLRGKHQVLVRAGVASLVLAKLGDLLALLLILVVASGMAWPDIPQLHELILALALTMLGVLLCAGLAGLFRARMVLALRRALVRLRLHHLPFLQRLVKSFDALAQPSAGLRSLLGPALGSSALLWCNMLLFAYCGVRTFDASLGLVPVALAVALTQVVAIVPIQVLGGLGVFDVAYTYVYGLFGMPYATAAAIVIGLRVLFYVFNGLLLLHLPAVTYVHTWRRKKGTDQ